ncbi:MAG: hypothetical protein V4615_07995 [Bacteroidota bacterium]
MFKSIREYENLHIVLWLLKDTCWVMLWRTGGMIMLAPTVAVAFYIAYRTRKDIHNFFHNIAVCCWICANGIWMTGEFFYDDRIRNYALVFFVLGLLSVTFYYLVYYPKKKPALPEEER